MPTDPAAVAPQQLVDRLVATGWVVAGHRTGQYMRLTWGQGNSLLTVAVKVPLDPTAPEYTDTMGRVLRVLGEVARAGALAAGVLAALNRPEPAGRPRWVPGPLPVSPAAEQALDRALADGQAALTND